MKGNNFNDGLIRKTRAHTSCLSVKISTVAFEFLESTRCLVATMPVQPRVQPISESRDTRNKMSQGRETRILTGGAYEFPIQYKRLLSMV